MPVPSFEEFLNRKRPITYISNPVNMNRVTSFEDFLGVKPQRNVPFMERQTFPSLITEQEVNNLEEMRRIAREQAERETSLFSATERGLEVGKSALREGVREALKSATEGMTIPGRGLAGLVRTATSGIQEGAKGIEEGRGLGDLLIPDILREKNPALANSLHDLIDFLSAMTLGLPVGGINLFATGSKVRNKVFMEKLKKLEEDIRNEMQNQNMETSDDF